MSLRNPFASSSRTSVNTQPGSTHAQSTHPQHIPPCYAGAYLCPNAPRTTHSNNTHRRNESFTMLAAPLRIGQSKTPSPNPQSRTRSVLNIHQQRHQGRRALATVSLTGLIVGIYSVILFFSLLPGIHRKSGNQIGESYN